MKHWQVGVNNSTFDRISITKDCQDAICEYLWNSYEAGATKVEVMLMGKPLEEATAIQIIDNGKGIEYDTLNETFGGLLSTLKSTSGIRIKSKTNQGKGRFSYISFASQVKWTTVYEAQGEKKSYSISMNTAEKRGFSTTDVVVADEAEIIGTTVEIPVDDSTTMGQLSYSNIEQKLLQEFSWFLYLNKERNFTLEYMGNVLDYNKYIDTNYSNSKKVTIQGEEFHVNIVVWLRNIDNASKVYYLGLGGEIYSAENTGFNNNTVDFFHNAFVKSSYINSTTHFYIAGAENTTTSAYDESAKAVFSQLKREVNALIRSTLKHFLVSRADKELDEMQERGSLPHFPSDEYSQLRKKDFLTVTRELYCVEPRIFHKLKLEQEKSLLGFLNLLLSSDERENILGIIEQVVSLTAEQRNNFANVLQITKLHYILDVINTISGRIVAIEQLKQVVFDMAKFANERDHIQKIVEQHFWLFGEQYHMLTADKTLATSLKEYEDLTNAQPKRKRKSSNKKKELSQRADIFLYTKRMQEDMSSEMLIVELKAPLVKLSLDVFNQIVRYANTIIKKKEFNSQNIKWKFYAICSEVEDDVKVKYPNFKQHGKYGLVDIIEDRFEIYALSWADVFQSFEARHSPWLEKLKIDYAQASAELGFDEVCSPSRDLANELSRKIIAINAN